MKDQFRAIVLNQSGEKFSREIKTLDQNFFKIGVIIPPIPSTNIRSCN